MSVSVSVLSMDTSAVSVSGSVPTASVASTSAPLQLPVSLLLLSSKTYVPVRIQPHVYLCLLVSECVCG